MLSFLPSLSPADPNNLFYTPLSGPSNNGPLSGTHSIPELTSPLHSQLRNHQQTNAHHGHHVAPDRSVLSKLRADENAIRVRKGNIRRFGAGWLKPPGIVKTLQAMDDEKAEREEQEINAQREAALAEAQAAQEEAEEEVRRQRLAEEGGDESTMPGERDLDADIPEAEGDGYDESDDDREIGGQEADDAWEDDSDGALTPVEGEGDYAEPGSSTRPGSIGIRGPMRTPVAVDLGMDVDLDAAMDEQDLDNDIPEAGSYEHTDTEAEDETDEGDADAEHTTPAQAGITGSSVFGSSPAGHAMYGRRVSGRGSRP